MAECGGDAAPEVRRHLVTALERDDLPELDLEVEALRARGALVEVTGDGRPLVGGQLTVEVLVDALDGVLAVHTVIPPRRSTPAWADTIAAAKPKPWHYWIAPILALSAFLIVIALLVGYYVRVLGPKYRGR